MIGRFLNRFQKRIGKHRYVFHHIPKCGGTSVRQALGQWFTCVMDYREASDVGDKFTEFCLNRHDPHLLTPGQILCSHFELDGCHLHERYPEALDPAQFRVITFIRDPLELQLSLYHYELRRGLIPNSVAFEDRIPSHKNYLSHCIPCTEADYKAKLRAYFFIGLVEKSQESFDRLADKLGKPKVQLKNKNRAPRTNAQLSPETLREFRRANSLDYLIYEECVRIYNEGESLA